MRSVGAEASVWRSAPFLRYWTGQAVSSFGDQVSALALPYLAVTTLSATPLQAGALTAALWTPHLLALLVGTWVDALGRHRRVLVLANLLQAAALVAVPALAALDRLNLVTLALAAGALGLGGVLFDSAAPGFFVRIARPDQYVAATALLSTTLGLSRVAGPAAGGALLQLVAAPVAVLVDAASFLLSAAATGSVRVDGPAGPPTGAEPFRRRLRHGVDYLLRHRILRASLLASTTMNIAAFAIQGLLVLYATRELGLSAAQIGLALGVGAVGGLLSAVTAGQVARVLGIGPAIAVGVALNAMPFAALPVAAAADLDVFVALCLAEFVTGWAIMLFDVANNALRTAVTRDDVRGRVSGAYSTVNYGIRPVGALAGGAVATLVGPGAAIAGASLIGTAALAWIVTSPISRIRRLPEA